MVLVVYLSISFMLNCKIHFFIRLSSIIVPLSHLHVLNWEEGQGEEEEEEDSVAPAASDMHLDLFPLVGKLPAISWRWWVQIPRGQFSEIS